MNVNDFWFRARRQIKSKALRLTGTPINKLVQINLDNAFDLEQLYPGVKTKTLIEEGGIAYTIPKHLPEDELEIIRPFQVRCESVLLEITNPGFSLRNHLLLDAEMNAWCADLLPHENILSSRKYAPRKILPLSGTVAYLSNTWVDNYYHWMQLTLPLLRLYKKFNLGFEADYFYVGESYLTRVQVETLEKFGIPSSKIIRQPCRAERIISVIYWHQPQHCGAKYRDIWGHQFVRSLYYPVKQSDGFPKRIYIERGDARTRRIVNESDLSSFLEAFGFVTLKMSGKSVADQAKLFGNADVIIGAHGAALTNILFAREGTKMIEIFPPGVHESSYFTGASYSNLLYSYLIADTEPHGNMSVSLTKMARLLEMSDV